MIDDKIKSTVSFEDTATTYKDKKSSDLRRMYWLFRMMNYPKLVTFGMKIIEKTLFLVIIRYIIKKTLFKQFCGGETLSDCTNSVNNLMNSRIYTFLAYSVEGKANDQEFDATTAETIRTIEFAAANKSIPFAVFKVTGLAKFELLEKIQANKPLNEEETNAWQKVLNRVDKICATAQNLDVSVLIDAEESWIQDTIDNLAYQMMEKYNLQKPIVYNTFQMYRKQGLNSLKQALETALQKSYFLGVKQVRGAYMEKERKRAELMKYDSPINPDKATTDKMYADGLGFCLQNIAQIGLCAGTHNEESCYQIIELMAQHHIPSNSKNVFIAQLYGMSDHISYNLANAGYNALKYVPYGSVREVIPYLFRRAQENTAIAGQSNREWELIKKEIRRRKLNQ